MLTRDKLEYQKRLRFLREARAKTASEQLKLAKAAEESDLTKRVVTLGDKENRVPARGETPKAYNEVPKTRETSRVKDPLEAGDKGDNALHIDLDDVDYAKISEQKRFYVKRVGSEERNEPYGGPEMEELGIEPQFYSDEAEAGTVADMLIDKDPHGMEDFYVANLEDDPVDIEDNEETMSDEEFEEMLKEATPPQEDADQSLARMKKRKKATRTKSLKRKSHAKLNESNLDAILKECGCQMQSPFDAPEDEPQGYMLKQSLEKIGSQATDLSNLANHDDDPEPWVEFKVTSAAENIDAVNDYIKYGRKHRSDMSGHEDMHDMHSNHDMMNEKILRKVIRKLLEQTGSTLISGPPDDVAASEPTTPAASTAPVATPDRVQRAVQACKSLFDPATPRSLINHLTRLLRGLQTRNPTIANYELNSHNAHMHLTYNVRALDVTFVYQGIPGRSDGEATRLYFDSEFGRRYSAALSGIRDALYIPGVNRIRTDADGSRHTTLFDWPRDIAQINPRLMADMIARIQRAIAIITAENSTAPNICDLISQIPTDSSTPSTGANYTTTPAPASPPTGRTVREAYKSKAESPLRKLIRNIVREQAAASIPINLATGAPAPTTTPVTPGRAATAAARPGTAYRRGMSPEVSGAINEIFSTDPTSRSLMNHLTRMLRGIQQNNAGVADGELANNQPYVNNTLNRRIPLIKTQRPDLAAVADELAAQINTFNRPAFPRTLAQLTNKPQAIARIQALINWLRTNQNRFTAAPATTPSPSPTPSTTPTTGTSNITPEQESQARANINNIVNQFNTLVRSIQDGTLDLSNESSRPAYLQQLDELATQRATAYAIVYKRAADLNRANAIRQIDARIAVVRQQITQNNQALATAQAEQERWGSWVGGVEGATRTGAGAGDTLGPLGTLVGGTYGAVTGLIGSTAAELTGGSDAFEAARNAVYARTAVARFLQNEISVLESVKVYVSNPNAAAPPIRLPSGTSITLPVPSATGGASTATTMTATTIDYGGLEENKKIKLGRLFRFT